MTTSKSSGNTMKIQINKNFIYKDGKKLKQNLGV